MSFELYGKGILISEDQDWQIAVDEMAYGDYNSSLGALSASNPRYVIVPPGVYNQGVTMRENVHITEASPNTVYNSGTIVNTVKSKYLIGIASPETMELYASNMVSGTEVQDYYDSLSDLAGREAELRLYGDFHIRGKLAEDLYSGYINGTLAGSLVGGGEMTAGQDIDVDDVVTGIRLTLDGTPDRATAITLMEAVISGSTLTLTMTDGSSDEAYTVSAVAAVEGTTNDVDFTVGSTTATVALTSGTDTGTTDASKCTSIEIESVVGALTDVSSTGTLTLWTGTTSEGVDYTAHSSGTFTVAGPLTNGFSSGDIAFTDSEQPVTEDDSRITIVYNNSTGVTQSETITAAAETAVSLTKTTTLDSTSNAIDATLADGTYIGQEKYVVMSDASNSSTLTVAHHSTSDPEVFTFDASGEYLLLKWVGTEWITVTGTATTS